MNPAHEMETRIVLIDHHEMVREGLGIVLAGQSGIRIVGSFGSAGEFLAAPPVSRPGIALVAPSPAGTVGEDIAAIQNAYSDCAILALGSSADDSRVLDIIRAGARGYIVKKASVVQLVHAIRTLARGGAYISPELSQWFVSRVHPRLDPLGKLSPRELEVMQLVARGMSSKEVAWDLKLEVETVRTYRKNLMRKLGINKLASLTRLAVSLQKENWATGSNGSHESVKPDKA